MTEIITSLFQAAEDGDFILVENILREYPALVNRENEHGLTLLGIAAHYGQFEVVKVCLNYGADINAISHSKLSFIPQNTALHAAIAGSKSTEIIDYLLLNGSDCNMKDSEGYTPLHIAAFEGSIPIAKQLIKYGAKIYVSKSGKTPNQIANERGHIEFINYLNESITI